MPYPPAPPTERITLIHPLTIHVWDVVDRTVPYMEPRPDYEPEEDEDLTRRHDYSRICYRRRVDGTGMGDSPRTGVHPFGGPGGLGIAGGWGGGRVRGLPVPVVGMPLPLPARAHARQVAVPMEEAAPACKMASGGMVVPVILDSSPPAMKRKDPPMLDEKAGEAASGDLALSPTVTAVGSAALVYTPNLPWSAASTTADSEAMAIIPLFMKGAVGCAPSPRVLCFTPNSLSDSGEKGRRPSPQSAPPRLVTQEGVVVQGIREELGADATRECPVPEAEVTRNHSPSIHYTQGSPVCPLLGEGVSGQSPPRTPHTAIVVPLEDRQLISPAPPMVRAFGPKSAANALYEVVSVCTELPVLGPRPILSVPARRKRRPPQIYFQEGARVSARRMMASMEGRCSRHEWSFSVVWGSLKQKKQSRMKQ